MKHKPDVSRILLIVAMMFVANGAPVPLVAQSSRVCFAVPGITHCIEGRIREYWERHGGVPVFGYPISPAATATNAEGWTGLTQWFERDRLEDHGVQGVVAGRLGVELLALTNRPWEDWEQGVPGGIGCRFFPETRHSLCPPFRQYWEQNGGVERFGYPISEIFGYRAPNGWNGPAQWFERRRMEDHAAAGIVLGLLGNELYVRVKPRAATAGSAIGH